ncbi:MAG: carbohydrate-binding protein [Candidatus Omnitrophota bacterium]
MQPTGAHDAYQKGDRVLFEGKTYESLIDANVWSPTSYPQGWKEI